jgi:hypothetical protein
VAVIALASAKGSPGVTTAALALTLSWPRDVLLVEADPAGGDLMAGYAHGNLAADRGLAHLAVSARRETIGEALAAQVIDFSLAQERTSRLFVPGVGDPAQAPVVDAAWPGLVRFFASLSSPGSTVPRDTIVDCGRLAVAYPPMAVLYEADLVLIVVRRQLRSASATLPYVTSLRQAIAGHGGDPDKVALLAIERGEYSSGEVAKALGVPVVATLPWREKDAAALSEGAGKISVASALLRSAKSAALAIVAHGQTTYAAGTVAAATTGGAAR